MVQENEIAIGQIASRVIRRIVEKKRKSMIFDDEYLWFLFLLKKKLF